MNLPTLPLRAAARLLAALTFAVCLSALAPAARAVEIQVEVLFDSLAQPPAPLSNICTLRKAVNNALGGPPEDGGESGDLDVYGDLIITGHPDGTTINAADLGRVFHVHPGATLTLVNIHLTNGNENAGGSGVYVS